MPFRRLTSNFPRGRRSGTSPFVCPVPSASLFCSSVGWGSPVVALPVEPSFASAAVPLPEPGVTPAFYA
jgi:hypothetical protein